MHRHRGLCTVDARRYERPKVSPSTERQTSAIVRFPPLESRDMRSAAELKTVSVLTATERQAFEAGRRGGAMIVALLRASAAGADDEHERRDPRG